MVIPGCSAIWLDSEVILKSGQRVVYKGNKMGDSVC